MTIQSQFRNVGIRDRLKRSWRTRHWLYLVCHAVIALIGMILILIDEGGFWRRLLPAVGTSLVAMGLGGAVLFIRVWLDRESEELRFLDNIREHGLRRIFRARSVPIRSEYDKRLGSVSDCIEIMGFGLKHLREDYADQFAHWAHRATVRILILDPKYPNPTINFAALRDHEERNEVGDIEKDVMRLIQSCAHLLKEPTTDFRIRLFTCLPSISIFRIDNHLFWGPYFVGDVSRNMPTLLMEASGSLSTRIIRHFDEIWNNEDLSREVPNSWLSNE